MHRIRHAVLIAKWRVGDLRMRHLVIQMLHHDGFTLRRDGAIMRGKRHLALDQQPAKRQQKHQQMLFQKAQAVAPVGVHIISQINESCSEYTQRRFLN